MSEKPKRQLVYNRPDGEVIGANYNADAMDEWLKAEVLPVLVDMSKVLHRAIGTGPIGIVLREHKTRVEKIDLIIAQLEE